MLLEVPEHESARHLRECVEEKGAAYTVTRISAHDCTSAVWPKKGRILCSNKFKLLSGRVDDMSYDRYQRIETSAVGDDRNICLTSIFMYLSIVVNVRSWINAN